MAVLLKRAREVPSPEDGARVLVDVQRPRGMSEDALELRAWLKELAPSEELRRWFMERPRQWPLFRRQYLGELCSEGAVAAFNELHNIAASEPTTTLLSSAKEPEMSHAAILRDLLQGARKPPSSTGPAKAVASGKISARRGR
jgi:uncharacterized protein YeaO (DUF488 family)